MKLLLVVSILEQTTHLNAAVQSSPEGAAQQLFMVLYGSRHFQLLKESSTEQCADLLADDRSSLCDGSVNTVHFEPTIFRWHGQERTLDHEASKNL